MIKLKFDPPVKDALVVLWSPSERRVVASGKTNENGEVTLSAKAGTYELWVAKEDFKAHKQTINIPETTSVSITLISAIKVGYGLPYDVPIELPLIVDYNVTPTTLDSPLHYTLETTTEFSDNTLDLPLSVETEVA